MGSKAPTWADQWGAGNLSDDEKDDRLAGRNGSNGGGKMAGMKVKASAGFEKAKTAASVSAQKVKTGTSVGFKWIKDQFDKKASSK